MMMPNGAAPAGGMRLLTRVDLRHTIRVRAFMDFATRHIGRKRMAIEGTAMCDSTQPGSIR